MTQQQAIFEISRLQSWYRAAMENRDWWTCDELSDEIKKLSDKWGLGIKHPLDKVEL